MHEEAFAVIVPRQRIEPRVCVQRDGLESVFRAVIHGGGEQPAAHADVLDLGQHAEAVYVREVFGQALDAYRADDLVPVRHRDVYRLIFDVVEYIFDALRQRVELVIVLDVLEIPLERRMHDFLNRRRVVRYGVSDVIDDLFHFFQSFMSRYMTAFCACSLFSASWNIHDCGPSMTSSVTSSPR